MPHFSRHATWTPTGAPRILACSANQVGFNSFVLASFKGLREPLAVSYLRERLALLLTLVAILYRITEGDNSQHIQIIRDAQE